MSFALSSGCGRSAESQFAGRPDVRVAAAIPAIGLLTGSAAGLLLPEFPLVRWRSPSSRSARAVRSGRWRVSRTSFFVGAIGLSFFAGGVLLAHDAMAGGMASVAARGVRGSGQSRSAGGRTRPLASRRRQRICHHLGRSPRRCLGRPTVFHSASMPGRLKLVGPTLPRVRRLTRVGPTFWVGRSRKRVGRSPTPVGPNCQVGRRWRAIHRLRKPIYDRARPV